MAPPSAPRLHLNVVLLAVSLMLGSAAATSFRDGLAPPRFTDLSTCGLLPKRLPRPMLVPPARADLCDTIQCPRAPNQCYYGEDSKAGRKEQSMRQREKPRWKKRWVWCHSMQARNAFLHTRRSARSLLSAAARCVVRGRRSDGPCCGVTGSRPRHPSAGNAWRTVGGTGPPACGTKAKGVRKTVLVSCAASHRSGAVALHRQPPIGLLAIFWPRSLVSCPRKTRPSSVPYGLAVEELAVCFFPGWRQFPGNLSRLHACIACCSFFVFPMLGALF